MFGQTKLNENCRLFQDLHPGTEEFPGRLQKGAIYLVLLPGSLLGFVVSSVPDVGWTRRSPEQQSTLDKVPNDPVGEALAGSVSCCSISTMLRVK